MKWKRLPGGGRVEDRRGMGGGTGGMRGLPIGVGGGGVGILLLLAFLLLSGNLGGGGGGSAGPLDPFPQAQTPATRLPDAEADQLADFSKRVYSDVDRVWADLFRRGEREYRQPRLVLFSGGTQSGCGGASAAVGPHYCPRDDTIYLDLSFFRELHDRFGASGDFAHAYVIAHEVGHHIQNVLELMERGRDREGSIRLELQADCLAGVWAHTAEQRGLLDPGDTQEALGAAAAVGDDRIQQRTQGRIDPESWTHGSAEQRMRWFTRGMRDGDPAACDTFSGEL